MLFFFRNDFECKVAFHDPDEHGDFKRTSRISNNVKFHDSMLIGHTVTI